MACSAGLDLQQQGDQEGEEEEEGEEDEALEMEAACLKRRWRQWKLLRPRSDLAKPIEAYQCP